jgi:phosphoribosylformylglycinamidine (FGAM) synthase-like amidotransferase family enzyme
MAHTTHWTPNSVNRSSVYADLVSAGTQHPACVFERPDATAHGEGDVNLLGNAVDHFDRGVTIVARCGDVEKHQFISTLKVIPGGQFDRIAGIAEIDKVRALDHAALGHVETWYDSSDLHDCSSCAAASAARPSETVNRPS